MKVLIIDGNNKISGLLKNIVDSIGLECDSFTNPSAALKEFHRQEYDMVVTGLKMLEIDGYDILRIVKEHKEETPVMVFSSYVDENTTQLALQAGAFEVFKKPVDIARLVVFLNIKNQTIDLRIPSLEFLRKQM